MFFLLVRQDKQGACYIFMGKILMPLQQFSKLKLKKKKPKNTHACNPFTTKKKKATTSEPAKAAAICSFLQKLKNYIRKCSTTAYENLMWTPCLVPANIWCPEIDKSCLAICLTDLQHVTNTVALLIHGFILWMAKATEIES